MFKLEKDFRNTLYYLFGSAIGGLLSLANISYASRVMNASDIAYLGLLNVLLFIAPSLLSLNSTGLVALKLVKENSFNYSLFRGKYLSFGVKNAGIYSFFVVIFFFLKGFDYFILLSPIFLFGLFLLDFIVQEYIQKGNARKVVLYTILYSILNFTFFIGINVITNSGWISRYMSLIVANLLFIVYILRNENMKLGVKITKREYVNILRFGAPLFISVFFGWILNQSDKLIVERVFGLTALASYTLAYSYSSLLNVFNTALSKVMVANTYNYLNKGDIKSLLRSIRNHCFIVTIVSIGAYVLADVLIPMLFTSDFKDVVPISRLLIISFWLNGIYRGFGGIISFYELNLIQMAYVFVASLISVVVGLFFTDYFEIFSPAFGVIIGYLILVILVITNGMILLQKNE